MYCEYCGKATEGGRCAACGRRPARLSLNVFALLVGWLSILGLYLIYSLLYQWMDQMFGGLGVELPLPTQLVGYAGRPFGSGIFSVTAVAILLLVAIVLRRARADKWMAMISFLLAFLQMLALGTVGMATMSLIHKIAR